MICAILLAAGRSQRMGAQKLLLPFAGGTVVGHILRQICASRAVDRVIAVVGADAEAVGAAVLVGQASRLSALAEEGTSGTPVLLATNPDPEGDMLSSVRCGLQAVPQECEGVLVALGDQPAITAGVIKQMADVFSTGKEKVVVPVHEGKQGHPILFAGQYRNEILTHYDQVGLRGLLQAHPTDLVEVAVGTPSVLSDMDYPEDYRREVERWERQRSDKSGQV